MISYDLDVALDPAGTIDGQVTIRLNALLDPVSRIRLDLVDELTVDAALSGGTDLAFTHGGDSLVIWPTEPLPPGAELDLTVQWHGRPPRHGNYHAGLLYRHHEAGTPDDTSDDQPTIASINEPWSAHSWWPCKDHPSDKALVSVALTVPDDLVGLSNGDLLDESVPGPGLRRFVWQEAYPIATYLVAVYASNYVSWSEACDVTVADPPGLPVPLEYHVFPQTETSARERFARTCEMLEFFTGLAGPYPFAGEKYAQLEVKWGGAMENQTVTAIGSFVFASDIDYEALIIHELSHHWFGDSLTPSVWADIWLNEGFARYAEALWIEHSRGAEAYRRFMIARGFEAHDDLFQEQGRLGDPDPVLPNILVYDKGAWVLHMLRLLIGDDDFFAFLSAYAQDPDLVHGSTTTADMIAVAEQVSARDLQGFFTPWLQTSEIPRIRYAVSVTDRDVTVEFHQLQETVFELAVPVVLQTATGPIQELAHLDSRHVVAQWTVAGSIETVAVDPDSLVLMQALPAPAQAIQIHGPYPNPLSTAAGSFELFLQRNGEVLVDMYDIAGRKVAAWNLGQVTATGLAGDEAATPLIWTWRPESAGRRLPSGTYALVFRTGSAQATARVTLLH